MTWLGRVEGALQRRGPNGTRTEGRGVLFGPAVGCTSGSPASGRRAVEEKPPILVQFPVTALGGQMRLGSPA
jgi:hypothetical protein